MCSVGRLWVSCLDLSPPATQPTHNDLIIYDIMALVHLNSLLQELARLRKLYNIESASMDNNEI